MSNPERPNMPEGGGGQSDNPAGNNQPGTSGGPERISQPTPAKPAERRILGIRIGGSSRPSEQTPPQEPPPSNEPATEPAIEPTLSTEAGGGGGGNRPEGPPLPPEAPRNPDWIWSPEFRREGRRIAREIFRLEGLKYKNKYNAENSPKLKKLYQEWKEWVEQVLDQSSQRRSFNESLTPEAEELGDTDLTPEELSEAERILLQEVAKDEKPPEKSPDSLTDENGNLLPSLTEDRKDDEGKIVQESLINQYNRLRSENAPEEQIKAVEQMIGRYFNEARRLGLLDSIDASLGPIYEKIMDGMSQKNFDPSKISEETEASGERVKRSGKRFFKLKQIAGKLTKEQSEKLDGVWDVYVDIALQRFGSIIDEKEIGVLGSPTIDGEFTFDINQVTLSTQSGEEGLRRFLPTDEELRAIANANLGEDRILIQLAKGDRDEFNRLVNLRERFLRDMERLSRGYEDEFNRLIEDREEVFKLLVQEREEQYRRNIAAREEALGNLGKEVENFRKISEKREIYWRPTYANYYTVYARTPEEFQIAVDTFTQWIRSGLTKSPNELFQRVSGFKDALTTQGVKEQANVDPNFMIGLRQELEAMIAVLGANHANEHYNTDYFKQFMDFLAADEGPDRMVRLGRASRGKISALLHKFDNDPRYELLFSTHGSRGQLFEERNPIEFHRLRAQLKEMLIEEVLGLDIKGYDPLDSQKRPAKAYFEGNLERLSQFMPDEEFKDLFEGMEKEDQDAQFKTEAFQKRLKRVERSQEIDRQIKAGKTFLSLNLTPQEVADYHRYQQGKLKLTEYEQRLVKAVRIREFLDKGNTADDLKDVDKRLYEFYEEAKNAVDLALEMYGVMGEKAKRSGGVLLVHKRDQDGKFADYIPIHWAEKFVQFAENWTKVTYGGELDEKIQQRLRAEKHRQSVKGIPADELMYRVQQARRMAIWSLKTYGFEAKLWDFTILRDGKPVDLNIIAGYSKYGTDETKDNTVEKYKYAVPENPRILGYNSAGEEVILVFDDQGKPVIDDTNGLKTGFRWDPQTGQADLFDKPATATDRKRVLFDNLNIRDTVARRMEFKTPKLKLSEDGVVYRPIKEFETEIQKEDGSKVVQLKKVYGEPEFEGVDLIHVDFETAIRHLYARWTGHPYWGYQEEDTGLVLARKTRKAAERIRNGQSRPEDEISHASHRLIMDPTLQRVGYFKNKESREDKIALNAVEESYQSHFRIRKELQQIIGWPDGPDVETASTAYVLQDDGGSTKQWFNMSFEGARWPLMILRRGRLLVSSLPLHFAPMSEMWGAGGALNVIRMMGFEEYKLVGLFAFQKWNAQTKGAQDIYDAVKGWVSEQEKRSREGWGEKINNDADSLEKLFKELGGGDLGTQPESGKIAISEDIDNRYINAVREVKGRPEVLQQRIRVLETDMRGERAPLFLEGIDIYERNDDGSIKEVDGEKVYNQKIDSNNDSGSSRHSGSFWYWEETRYQRTVGQQLYPTVVKYLEPMDDYTFSSKRVARVKNPRDYDQTKLIKIRGVWYDKTKLQTRWQWEQGKTVR